MDELKPCPFCGGVAETYVRAWGIDDYEFTVSCPKCDTSKSVRLNTKKRPSFDDLEVSRDAVIRDWNKMAELGGDLIPRQAAIKEIKRFIGYLDEDMIERLKIAINGIPSVEKGGVENG